MNLLSNFLNKSGVLENTSIIEDYGRLFVDGEQIEVGFKIEEDTFIFTNRRLIFIEVRKGDDSGIEYISLPYSNIDSFSVDSKKSFHAHGFLKIWLHGQQSPRIEKEFNKSVDVYAVQKILAGHVIK
ncbi:PH domain-containing protein [Marivirga sericea]|uniref:PH domain-containing protein n=1 Tax=Marivirga sericea TaxID=1028 RepID=A0A1X7IQF7_9BACT|nr:PH domain-containing protein [Marivirga sericea]SMG17346.1 PH domain-containing protein [Marivirga sericea]